MTERIFARAGFTVHAIGDEIEVSIFDARSNSYSHTLSTKDAEALRTSIATWLREQKTKRRRQSSKVRKDVADDKTESTDGYLCDP